jgi:hypothetical protein
MKGKDNLLSKVKKESKVMDQWEALNKILFIYKAGGAALAGLCFVLGILAIILASRKPIVAVATDTDYVYLFGHRGDVPLNETNIKRFIEHYIKLAYQWDVLNPDKITKDIAPLVTEDFRTNLLIFLKNRKDKDFVGKTIKQDVSGLLIQVSKDSTIASFDVILRIEGIPLIVPTQVSFQLTKGSQTEWNPLGLYINGETLHEGK